jgi:hypothetical protein
MRWAWGAMRVRWRSKEPGDGFALPRRDHEGCSHSIYTAIARALKRTATPLSSSQFPVAVFLRSCRSSARRSASSSRSISSRSFLRTMIFAPARSASLQCLTKLFGPKCEGKRVGGVRRIALVPVPSREGTMTTAGAAHSVVRRPSISPGCINGRSRGKRRSPATPHSAHRREAKSTDELSETW